MLEVYNTLTRKKEEFIPINKNKVGIYACGVTPYKPSHLGHAMQGIIFDVIRSYLVYKGYEVTYVRNYTDVDDKIINRANELGEDPLTYVKKIIDQTDAEFKKLRVKPADFSPKVTENISEIISMVEELISQKKAYATKEGNVYFSVKSFKEYGELSRQKLDMLRANSRKDGEEDKEDAIDFAVWKAAKPNEIFWESPWGKGRPGWHIECSVMSMKHLGKTFDIHGGGEDLIFPHHENEKAQSESIHTNSKTHKGEYAKYWFYNGLLLVDGQKMSKSLKNDISISEMLEKYHPEVIRYMIVSNHYRSHINFVPARYDEANKSIYSMYKTLKRAQENVNGSDYDKEEYESYIKRFETSMDEDFNTVEVIALLHEYSKNINDLIDKSNSEKSTELSAKINSFLKFVGKVSEVIGTFDLKPEDVIGQMEESYLKKISLSVSEIESKIQERNSFRKSKSYAEADQIRSDLETKGILLNDQKEETVWEVKFF